jgi:hypothetical protein
MDGRMMGEWVEVWRDSEKRIERRDTGQTGEGGPVFEERTIYAQPNRQTLTEQARQAMAANRTFLALASPSQAQSLAQIRALTRQVQALIRFTLADFDDVN